MPLHKLWRKSFELFSSLVKMGKSHDVCSSSINMGESHEVYSPIVKMRESVRLLCRIVLGGKPDIPEAEVQYD
jgi:hypothetical protein